MPEEEAAEVVEVEVLEPEEIAEFGDSGYDIKEPWAKRRKRKHPRGTRKQDFPLFTPAVREAILQATRLGATLKIAANNAGVRKETAEGWMIRGEEALERFEAGEELIPIENDFLHFYLGCLQSKSAGALRLIGILQKASKNNPNIAMKLLEKLEPEDYGAKQAIEMTGKVAHAHAHLHKGLPTGDDVAKQLSSEELRLLRADIKQKDEQKKLAADNAKPKVVVMAEAAEDAEVIEADELQDD
jgi:hypothetical protein